MLNFKIKDVNEAFKEYENVAEYFSKLKDVLKMHQDFEINPLKDKIIVSYNKLSGDFKTRLNNITEHIAERNNKDGYYVFFIRVVLIYFFEICIIGKKTENEK